MATRSKFTSPSMIQPLAKWVWALWLGLFLFSVDFVAGGVQLLPASGGMLLLALAAWKLRDEYMHTALAAAALVLLVWSCFGAVVELPRSFGMRYGSWLRIAHDIFLAMTYGILGAVFLAISREVREHGFHEVAFGWFALGAGLAGGLSLPWLLLSLGEIGGLQLSREVNAHIGTATRIGTLCSIGVLGLLWLFTARTARSRPIKRKGVEGSTCTRCGSDLRALSGTLCPECGAEQR